MDEIKQIYSNPSYSDFLDYCEQHNYRLMRDLAKCRFEALPEQADIPPALLNRIKTIYVLYIKKHPQCLEPAKPVKPKSAVTDGLREELLMVFEKNSDKLIHINDLIKAIGKGVKRNDIINALEGQKWCRMVDNTTFFYVPLN